MRISNKGEYALKAILDLSYHYQDRSVIPLTSISRRQDIPLKFLEQIMLILKKAGYVESKRGIKGGFFLLKSPQEVTLGDIIRLMEGQIGPVLNSRNESYSGYSKEEEYAIREVWMKVTGAVSKIIDSVTFSHIMRRADELREQKVGYTYQI